MNNKHTPGTWYAKDGQIYPTETGKTLALIPYFDKENEEQQANQKLIAAAPKLLEALNKANDMLFTLSNSYCRNKDGYLKENAAKNGWDAAIDILIQDAINAATE